MKEYTVDDLARWRAEWSETVPVSVFTTKEFDLLGFAPSTLHKINDSQGFDFPIDGNHHVRQCQGDIIGQYAVLECAVRHGYFHQQGNIESKLHNANRLLHMSGARQLLCWPKEGRLTQEEREREILTGRVPISSALRDSLFCEQTPILQDFFPKANPLHLHHELKLMYGNILQRCKITDTERNQIRPDVRRRSYGFVPQLQHLFGEDITVLLYGSATFDNKRPNDYDTIVIVDRIERGQYEHLAKQNNSRRALHTQPLEWEGTPIDVLLVQRKEWEPFIAFNPYALGIVQNSIVVHGDVEFPPLNVREQVLRTVSRAVGRIRMLHGVALNWAGLHPEELVTKEGLFYSLSKVPRYVAGALLHLNESDEGKPIIQRSKDEVDSLLETIGITIRPFSPEPVAIQRGLYRIMQDTARVVEHFTTPTWTANYADPIEELNNPGEAYWKEFREVVKNPERGFYLNEFIIQQRATRQRAREQQSKEQPTTPQKQVIEGDEWW